MTIIKKKLQANAAAYQINALMKAWLQERKAATELIYYRRKLERKKLVIPDKISLQDLLRERLKKRRASLSKKPKGALHIFLAYGLTNWEAVLPQALTAFGRVTEFEWRGKGFNDNASDWFRHKDRMNEDMLAAFFEAHKAMPVDVVVGYFTNATVNLFTLHRMKEAGAVLFNFCWDDTLYFDSLKDLVSSFDLNLTNVEKSLVKYAAQEGLCMFWPEAAQPEIHHPFELSFFHDVTFVGKKYGWRPNFIAYLQKKGIPIVCFGEGWNNKALSGEDMVKLYSQSRINLGFSGIGYSKKLTCLKGRDFEVPMSGGLYVTQDNPDLRRVYDVGKEIVAYRNKEDCLRQIRWLLDNPDEADKIRKAGRARALKDHTWQRRFEEIFQMAGIMAGENG